MNNLIPYYKVASGTGMHLDLANGAINGYNLMLQGTNTASTADEPKTIIIDSSSSTTPLRIGKDFSVAWDGTLNCNKVNSLNNDGNNNKAISISNNFYVTQGGSAGGSGVSFSGGFSGGFYGTARGTGIFSKLTVGDEDGGTSSLNGTTTIKGKLTIPSPVTVGSTELITKQITFMSGNTLDVSGSKAKAITSVKGGLISGITTESAEFLTSVSVRMWKYGLTVLGTSAWSANTNVQDSYP
jgi:hypothetical protein